MKTLKRHGLLKNRMKRKKKKDLLLIIWPEPLNILGVAAGSGEREHLRGRTVAVFRIHRDDITDTRGRENRKMDEEKFLDSAVRTWSSCQQWKHLHWLGRGKQTPRGQTLNVFRWTGLTTADYSWQVFNSLTNVVIKHSQTSNLLKEEIKTALKKENFASEALRLTVTS